MTGVRGPGAGNSSFRHRGPASPRMYRRDLHEAIVVATSENPYVFNRGGHEIEVTFTPKTPTLIDRDAARQLVRQGVLEMTGTEGTMWKRQRLVVERKR